MLFNNILVKPDTRNLKGFFVQEVPYKLVDIDHAGWALICMSDAVCHYVDPDNLERFEQEDSDEV